MPAGIEPEHPDAFSEALAAVQATLPPNHQLQLDGLWGQPPHLATARFGERVVAGRGDTPAAALRDLARQLEELRLDAG
jgi:hypothetical protein